MLEILRVQMLAGSSVAQVACTFGEVAFLALLGDRVHHGAVTTIGRPVA